MKNILIVYHSGTGSTKLTSELIGEKLKSEYNVTIKSIHCIEISTITKWDLVIVGFPTYHCEPSISMLEFLSRLKKNRTPLPAFIFTTYGLYSGNCVNIAYQKLKEPSLPFLVFEQKPDNNRTADKGCHRIQG